MMKLLFGDCLDFSGKIPPADLVVADLPYGATKNGWDKIIPFNLLWEFLRNSCSPDAMLVFTATQPFASRLVLSNERDFCYDWVWEKSQPTGHLNARRMPMRAHEHILVFAFGKPVYYPIKTTGHPRKVSTSAHKKNCKQTSNYGEHGLTSYDSTERFPRSVIKFPTDKQWSKIAPTQKPVSLMEYLVKTYSREGHTVLDCCMGSGSTGAACRNTGRSFVGIEKDLSMFEAAVIRLGVKASKTET